MNPDLSVIVVSYNTREMTLKCLGALQSDLSGMAAEVWVVDNGSSDGSAAAIGAAFPDVHVVENPSNAGFGAANNLAFARAKGKYLLLLNSDAFVRPGALRAMIDAIERDSRIAVVGPRLLNGDGSLQVSCFRFPSPARCWAENLWIPKLFSPASALGDYRRWNHDREREVDWVIGACMLVRRQAYEEVGGFDQRFFMYAEETDWERRMRDRSWKIVFTPAAEVVHLGGASGQAEKPRVNRMFFHSWDHYGRKHHGRFGLILMRLAVVAGCMLRLPGWFIVALLVPRRRTTAWGKVRLRSWLCIRQVTHWQVLA